MGLALMLKKLLIGRAFSAEDGRMTILGKYDVTLYESKAWAFTVQKIYEKLGEKATFEIFYKAGQIAFEQAEKTFKIKISENLMRNFQPIMDFFGWGGFIPIEYVHEGDKLSIIVKLINSPVVEYGKILFGKNSKVCIFFRAILSGVFSMVYKKNVIFEEVACFNKGAEACFFKGRFKNEKRS
ncbi:MAG: hypothetical protein N3A69_10720 [Leptospiraceae bacterium]|nr:hypothetical protein [Leptospiraceae bacterium]